MNLNKLVDESFNKAAEEVMNGEKAVNLRCILKEKFGFYSSFSYL